MQSGSSTSGLRLAALAVELLSPARGRARRLDLQEGARRAIDLRLAGIFRMGLRGRDAAGTVAGPLAEALRRAERMEAADHLGASRQAREALAALRGADLSPVVLKGGPLAERLWPKAWMRPPGDLDLLVDEATLGTALAVLVRAGYRPRSGDASGRWRPTLAGVELQPRASGSGIDLHTRLFRSVGSGIDTSGILSRATPAELCGIPIRVLDPADEILHLAIHAAVHGSVHPKWLLDLRFAAMLHPPDAWREAGRRALLARATRPFWAGVQMICGPSGEAPRDVACRLRPSPLSRGILRRLVFAQRRTPRPMQQRLHGYALEWCLEERRSERARRLKGLIERQVRKAMVLRGGGRARPSGSATATHRWIAASLRGGRPRPIWLTLRGGSMAPVLRDGDRLLAAPIRPGATPREGAVVIAGGPAGLVAHRLVARSGGAVVTRGDSCSRDDSPVPIGDVLAEVIAVDPGAIGAIRRLEPALPEVNASHSYEVTRGGDK